MWEIDRRRPWRRWRKRHLSLGKFRFIVYSDIILPYSQGVLRAMEEYGIPVDHIGGKGLIRLGFNLRRYKSCHRNEHWSLRRRTICL